MMIRTKLVAATLLVACGFGAAMYPDSTPEPRPGGSHAFFPTASAVAPDTAPALPEELRYVPADAAFFLHVDAAKLWNGSLGKSLRAADAKVFDELIASTKKAFGVAPDALKSATLFVPVLKQSTAAGIVLVFNGPYDKAKLKAGFEEQLYKGTKSAFVTPSDRVAVMLVNLDAQTYGKPQPAEKTGPLTATIREAGTGKHLLVVGSTLANLPDEIRGELPPALQPFKPLLQAEAISAVIDLDKELTVEIRVKAPNAPQAKEAEKALGFLATSALELLGQGLKDADREPTLTEIKSVLEALQTGLKNAKYSTEGDETRVKAKVTAELPFALAYLAGKRKVTDAAARMQSTNNLKQIAIGMHNYHDVHGALPPAAVCDKTGKPLLSWRVLILPYIEQNNLYKQFKLDEPWDSDHNKKLIVMMPKTYILPSMMMAKANETHYRVFVGNGAAFDTIKGSKFTDFADGTSNTILVATAKDAVPWTKPDELAFDPDKDMTKLLGFFPGEVCPVAMADGSVRALAKTISKKALHAAITTSGGEVFEEDK